MVPTKMVKYKSIRYNCCHITHLHYIPKSYLRICSLLCMWNKFLSVIAKTWAIMFVWWIHGYELFYDYILMYRHVFVELMERYRRIIKKLFQCWLVSYIVDSNKCWFVLLYCGILFNILCENFIEKCIVPTTCVDEKAKRSHLEWVWVHTKCRYKLTIQKRFQIVQQKPFNFIAHPMLITFKGRSFDFCVWWLYRVVCINDTKIQHVKQIILVLSFLKNIWILYT